MNLYPRSFLRLILLGWILMALPLLFAIAFASVSLSKLSARSETAMQHASQATRLGWELEEDLVQMERILRQYEVLGDASLLDDYAAARSEWRTNAEAFTQVPLLASLAARTEEMRVLEATAFQKLLSAGTPALKPLRETLVDFKGRTFDLIEEVGRLSEAERLLFRTEAETLQQQLLIAVSLALLLAGTLLWFSRRVVAQVLGSIERAVIALGNNLLDRRIRLKGPDDVRWIGKRLDWLRCRLLTLENERTRMLRHISHELKTPLAALREGSSLLSEGVAGPLSPQQTKIANIMQGNALRLQALIDGLLRLQQAEHLRDRIAPEPLRLDEIVQQVLATHELAARDKRLRLTGTLAPLTIEGGREEITTIVSNLVSNAIKFSPERGTVRLTLSRDQRRAVIDVMDEGPGVPEADRKMIFEPFYRGPETKSVAGTGLGLAIAREFATAHNGSLDYLESANGAHFRATLPLAGEKP